MNRCNQCRSPLPERHQDSAHRRAVITSSQIPSTSGQVISISGSSEQSQQYESQTGQIKRKRIVQMDSDSD